MIAMMINPMTDATTILNSVLPYAIKAAGSIPDGPMLLDRLGGRTSYVSSPSFRYLICVCAPGLPRFSSPRSIYLAKFSRSSRISRSGLETALATTSSTLPPGGSA